VSAEINYLRNQVAVLLACARTRIDKARWTRVQCLLQEAGLNRGGLSHDLIERLEQEREFLLATIAGEASEDAAIMPRL
jgi:hypothetical protein